MARPEITGKKVSKSCTRRLGVGAAAKVDRDALADAEISERSPPRPPIKKEGDEERRRHGAEAEPRQPLRLLTKGEVLELVGVSYTALWLWIRDGKFPPGRAIGVGAKGHVAWVESEVLDWINSRPLRLPKGSKVAP